MAPQPRTGTGRVAGGARATHANGAC
uniref:Uncharacterized protein n=1 Tax=Arundo donax TaxID=35708 RepID=A0A0A8ZTG4_ARUDO